MTQLLFKTKTKGKRVHQNYLFRIYTCVLYSYLAILSEGLDTNNDSLNLCTELDGNNFCRHNGICKYGSKAIDQMIPLGVPLLHTVSSTDGKYCDCGESFEANATGHLGYVCGTKYEVCPNGSHICLHGAPCVQVTNTSSVEEYGCDCSLTTDTGEEMKFVGKSCEMKITDVCPNDGTIYTYQDLNRASGTLYRAYLEDVDLGSSDGIWFCANNGDCRTRTDKKGNIHQRCACPDSYSGPHCEYFLNNPGDTQSCDLTCENEGQCRFGVKDYNNLSQLLPDIITNNTNIDNQHCVCPIGFTGLLCDVKIDICGADESVCLHGSQCVEHTDNDGNLHYFCDCDKAKKQVPNGLISYAGEHCEHESNTMEDGTREYCAESLVYDFEEFFCTNGGKCPHAGGHHKHCECDENWTGPRCEFPIGTSKICDLDCQNDGECYFGLDTFGLANPFLPYLPALNNVYDQSNHIDSMHCKCPSGYTGLRCEYEVKECGLTEHICFFGGTCVYDVDSNHGYSCDCSTTVSTNNVLGTRAFAGAFCEFESTEICPGSNKDIPSFCTNSGTCASDKKKLKRHEGCICRNGFYGPHCEYTELTKSFMKNSEHNADKKGNSATIALAVVLTFSFLFLAVAILYYYKGKRSHKHESVANHTINNVMPSAVNGVTQKENAPKVTYYGQRINEEYEFKDIDLM